MRLLIIFSIFLFLQCGSENKNVNAVSTENRTVITGNSPSNVQKNMENKAFADEIEYSFDVKKVENEYVEITYKISNKSEKSFLVFNRGDTNKGLGAGRVYVEPSSNGSVELSQKRFSEPAGKSCPIFEIAVNAGAIWLKPKQTITETVKTALPLAFYTPFDECRPKDELPKEIKTVKFCLGIAEADAEKINVSEKGFVENWQAVGEQKLLCSNQIDF